MSPKLPVVSGHQLIRALEQNGYGVVRQRGSHVRLRDDAKPEHPPLTIPHHKTIKPGLLRKILRDVDLTIDEFVAVLN